MTDKERVKIGLQCIINGNVRCESCGYAIDKHGHHSCQQNCASEALDMLNEDLGTELTNAVELIHKKNEQIDKLLKLLEKQEPKQIVRKQGKRENSDGSIDYFGEWYCPHCGKLLNRGFDLPWIEFCYKCGQAVEWTNPTAGENKTC